MPADFLNLEACGMYSDHCILWVMNMWNPAKITLVSEEGTQLASWVSSLLCIMIDGIRPSTQQ
jgi:hypothetical protein